VENLEILEAIFEILQEAFLLGGVGDGSFLV